MTTINQIYQENVTFFYTGSTVYNVLDIWRFVVMSPSSIHFLRKYIPSFWRIAQSKFCTRTMWRLFCMQMTAFFTFTGWVAYGLCYIRFLLFVVFLFFFFCPFYTKSLDISRQLKHRRACSSGRQKLYSWQLLWVSNLTTTKKHVS